MKTRLYYEAHITVAADSGHPDFNTFEHFAEAARYGGWKASRFNEDEVDDMSGMWFASNRHDELGIIKHEVLKALFAFRNLGYSVLRWKIEDTVVDSKHGDEEGALRG